MLEGGNKVRADTDIPGIDPEDVEFRIPEIDMPYPARSKSRARTEDTAA